MLGQHAARTPSISAPGASRGLTKPGGKGGSGGLVAVAFVLLLDDEAVALPDTVTLPPSVRLYDADDDRVEVRLLPELDDELLVLESCARTAHAAAHHQSHPCARRMARQAGCS